MFLPLVLAGKVMTVKFSPPLGSDLATLEDSSLTATLQSTLL